MGIKRGMVGRAVRFLRVLGPGLITGAADDDPSGISTYSVAGASTGYSLLWIVLISTPMMAVIQGMCARISMVKGEGLAAVIRQRMPAAPAFALGGLVVVANTFNVGADLAGMSEAARLIVPIPADALTFFFGVGLILAQVSLPYSVLARAFKWLALTLVAYIVTAFVARPDWGDVFLHFATPHVTLNSVWISTLVAVLGTTITPYLFFWQSSLMVEEDKLAGKRTVAQRRGTNETSIANIHADVNTGMIFSNLVAFFIIVCTAATLGAHGHHDIASAQDAARALRPLAGNFASVLFTIGLVSTGVLAVPVLATSSAYVAAELLRFREGLNEPLARATRFYGVIAAGILVGVAMDLMKIDAVKALFWAAILNGVAAVPLIAVIVRLASDRSLMGRWVSSRSAQAWGWGCFTLMFAATLAMLYFDIRGSG